MRLLGNDLWDDIIDINDKKRKHQSVLPQSPNSSPSENMDKKGISGVTIFYRVLGSILLIATVIKSWFWSATIFDWTLLIVSLILIGVHRRFGASYVMERVKPAFLDLHDRLSEIEKKIDLEKTNIPENINE